MKKEIALPGLFALFCLAAHAQPILVSTMPLPPVGTIDSIFTAGATISPGSGGPGLTWNFSGLSPTLQGTATIVTPSTTPYYSTFPTATLCLKFTPTGSSTSVYDYDRLSAAKWEQLANDFGGTGTGTDYSPNQESNLNFPFSYPNTTIDTFQKTGGSANPVTITYDAYGTLTTPFGTYSNVVRVEKYYGVGDYDYDWYSTSPYLFEIMSFDAQSNIYTLIGTGGSASGIKKIEASDMVQLYPNPMYKNTTLKIDATNGFNNTMLTISNTMGQTVKQIAIRSSETTIPKDGLPAGLYFYSVLNNNIKIASGKLVIQ